MCGFNCPKLVNSKLCCPVSLQLSIRLLDMFCACNDRSDSDKQTSLLIDIYLNFCFLTLLSDFSRRRMFVHKKVDRYICTVIHALTELLWYTSLNFCLVC